MEAVRQISYDTGISVSANPMMGIKKKKNNAQPVEEYLGDWKMQPMRAWDDVYEDLLQVRRDMAQRQKEGDEEHGFLQDGLQTDKEIEQDRHVLCPGISEV